MGPERPKMDDGGTHGRVTGAIAATTTSHQELRQGSPNRTGLWRRPSATGLSFCRAQLSNGEEAPILRLPHGTERLTKGHLLARE